MQTNNAHNYTDAQLQAAIDEAFPAGERKSGIPLENNPCEYPRNWSNQATNRLAIARAFLAALPNEGAPATSDPYARLKAYAKAGARIRTRFSSDGPWTQWSATNILVWSNSPKDYEVHPDDLHMVPEYAPKLPAEASAEPLPIATLAQDQVQATLEQQAATESALRAEIGANAQPADDGPAWIPHDGGPCPLKDSEVEKWEYRMEKDYPSETFNRSAKNIPSCFFWNVITHYRVLKWKPGHGPQAAKPEPAPDTFEAHGKTWTRHTPGDPCPCDPEARVEVLLRNGRVRHALAKDVSWLDFHHRPNAEIIGWCYADEPAQAQEAPTEAAEDEARQERIRMTVNEGLNRRCHELHDMLSQAEAKIAELQASHPPQDWTPKPGDVVRLKSGGPEMTVESVTDFGIAFCSWMTATGSLETRPVAVVMLQPAKEEARP